MEDGKDEIDDVNVAAMFDLSQKKKKKKKPKTADGAEEGAAAGDKAAGTSSSGPLVDPQGPPTYTYKQLLQRVTDLLVQNNPELTDRRRPTMKPPQLMKGDFEYSNYWARVVDVHVFLLLSWYEEDRVDQFPRNMQDYEQIYRSCLPVYDG
jgi:hypothetical protein